MRRLNPGRFAALLYLLASATGFFSYMYVKPALTVYRDAAATARNIVASENRFLEAVIAGAFDLTPVPRPDSVRTADDVNRWYAPRFATHVEACSVSIWPGARSTPVVSLVRCVSPQFTGRGSIESFTPAPDPMPD